MKRQENGGWRLQIRDVNGVPKNLKLSKRTTAKAAAKFKEMVSKLVQSQKLGQAIEPKDKKWISDLGKAEQKKLRSLGIEIPEIKEPEPEPEPEAETPTIVDWINTMIKERSGIGTTTEIKYEYVKELMREKFGDEKRLDQVTKGEAANFYRWLSEPKPKGAGLAKHSTAKRLLGYIRSVWKDAIDHEVITVSPWLDKKMTVGVKTNKDRHFYIKKKTREDLYEVIPDGDYKLRFVLMAFAGLRSPSELNVLRWRDVDFEKEEFTLCSPKTAHHADGGKRTVPMNLHPLIRTEFDKAWIRLEEGDKSEFVLPSISNNVLRRHVIKWIGKLGLDLWPQLLTNFRRSAVTDMHVAGIPSHLVDAWFGHTEGVSKESYRMENEEARKLLDQLHDEPENESETRTNINRKDREHDTR